MTGGAGARGGAAGAYAPLAAGERIEEDMSNTTLVQAELDRLVTLGAEDAIAADLHARGVVGDRGLHSCCPLAVHLCDVLGEYASATVLYDGPPGRVALTSRGKHGSCVLFSDPATRLGVGGLPLPPLVESFVMAFDSGAFPELVEDSDA